MKGKDVKKIIKSSDFTIAEIANLSGIPEQTIYSLYKKEEVAEYYINKLQNIGLEMYTTLPTVGVHQVHMKPVHHGEALRLILREKKINQQDFADAMTTTRGHLQQMFNRKKFKDELINKVCAKLKISKSIFPIKKHDFTGTDIPDQEFDLELKMLRIRVKDLEEINKLLKEKLKQTKMATLKHL